MSPIILKARDLVNSGDTFHILSHMYQKDNYGKLELAVTIVTLHDKTEKILIISSSHKRDHVIETAIKSVVFKLVSKPFVVNGEQRTYFDMVEIDNEEIPF
jgi:hypothetical protein